MCKSCPTHIIVSPHVVLLDLDVGHSIEQQVLRGLTLGVNGSARGTGGTPCAATASIKAALHMTEASGQI